MRILALTFGPESTASSLYRVYQYVEPLALAGIRIEAYPAEDFESWKSLGNYDAVLIQKKLFRTGRAAAIRQRVPRLIYDLDDAIWEPHGRPHHWLTRWRTQRRLRHVTRFADCCLAANRILADGLRPFAQRVEVIPMSLDETIWHPPGARPAGRVRIGWAGAPANLSYLAAIEPALLAVQRAHPEVEIVVYCGRAPEFKSGLKVIHIPFEPGAEPTVVRSFDIGLLPLPNNAFARGKSPIKGLQYMACGVATVVNPHGATREMFQAGKTAVFIQSEEDWTPALSNLVKDTTLRMQVSIAANAEFRRRYARSIVARELANAFRSLDRKRLTG